ncbi:MAG: DUF4422 domain-containing protein [Clostridia bacterium]|nr:DUF4422 domain-containing protein [Clostridia bacterium]
MEHDVTVKLLVCYHKPDKLLRDEILTPIHVGRSCARAAQNPDLSWMEANMIGDDTGENISELNSSYNELTATYWAWKNYDKLGNPDYLGLMHYRRHFIFDRARDLSFVEYEQWDDAYLDFISYSTENVRNIVRDQDIVYYRGKVSQIYEHYRDNHRIEDLDLALGILGELHPEDRAIAADYVKGDTGCFCNMAIFSREMFFAYCAWLFPILEEFARCVDMSEKRFFISERLTGIFVAKMQVEGKKTLPLASVFVQSEYRIPVAMPLTSETLPEVAITVKSFLEHAKKTTHIDFYFLTEGVEEVVCAPIVSILSKRTDFSVNFVDVMTFCTDRHIQNEPKHYPLYLAELLPKVKKCFYATANVYIMRDIEAFFRLCSVDDFWIVGAGSRDDAERFTRIGDSCVLNLERMRAHRFFDAYARTEVKGQSLGELLAGLCCDQVSFYPAWFWINADEKTLSASRRERSTLETDAVYHPMICYADHATPIDYPRAVYSVFWWRTAHSVSTELAQMPGEKAAQIYKILCSLPSETRLIFKIRRYYRQYGFKGTVKRFFAKLFK